MTVEDGLVTAPDDLLVFVGFEKRIVEVRVVDGDCFLHDT
jgi:hypothetical protein